MADKGKNIASEFSRVTNRRVTASERRARTGLVMALEMHLSKSMGTTAASTNVSASETETHTGEEDPNDLNSYDDSEEESNEQPDKSRSRDEQVTASKYIKLTRSKRGRFDRFYEGDSSSVAASDQGKRVKDKSWIVNCPCPGGPFLPDVIPSFGGHIAHVLWSSRQGGRPLLKTYNRANKVREISGWQVLTDVRTILSSTGLVHLNNCVAEHINTSLIAAFVERWQPDTNTFHMRFGEITILLHDVARILGIDGNVCAVVDSTGKFVDPVDRVCEFFGMAELQLRKPLGVGETVPVFRSGGVLARFVETVAKQGSNEFLTRGFLALLTGNTLFVDRSSDRIRPLVFPLTCDAERVAGYAWGAGTLAYMYRQLGIASRADAKGVTRCLSLLQAWIYEYFPVLRPGPPAVIDPTSPRASAWTNVGPFGNTAAKLLEYRRLLDRLDADSVCWQPFGDRQDKSFPRTLFSGVIRVMDIGEPYQADRCLRQFGHMQVIPGSVLRGDVVHRPAESRSYRLSFSISHDNLWENFRVHRTYLQELSSRAKYPSEVDPAYTTWYNRVSHPLIIDPEGGDASTAHVGLPPVDLPSQAILWRFAEARKITDKDQQLAYFHAVLNQYESFIPPSPERTADDVN